jgi:hypothetical protein
VYFLKAVNLPHDVDTRREQFRRYVGSLIDDPNVELRGHHECPGTVPGVDHDLVLAH